MGEESSGWWTDGHQIARVEIGERSADRDSYMQRTCKELSTNLPWRWDICVKTHSACSQSDNVSWCFQHYGSCIKSPQKCLVSGQRGVDHLKSPGWILPDLFITGFQRMRTENATFLYLLVQLRDLFTWRLQGVKLRKSSKAN